MKRRTILRLAMVGIFCLLFNPLSATADGKVKSLEELIERYDSSSCKECHEEIHNQWEGTLHALSAFGSGGGRTAATFRTAVERGWKLMPHSGVESYEDIRSKHIMGCAKCHLPQLAEANEATVQEFMETVYDFYEGDDEASEVLQQLNINCLICHNYKAITHKMIEGQPQPDTVYGSQDGAHDHPVYSKMKKGDIMSESLLCGQCHGLGPNLEFENPTQCATLYGSYLFSYIPEGGQETCQECHMRKHGHGHNIKAYTDETMYKAAIDVVVDTQGYYWRKSKEDGVLPTGVVQVAITNKAGHVIPDG